MTRTSAPLLILVACGGASAAPDAAVPDATVPDAAPPPASGQVVLDGCVGLDGVDESCLLVENASACIDAPCAKLVVAFSGGDEGCANAGYTTVTDGYAALGWAAVCINGFETATGSESATYLAEADRLDLAVRAATTGAWAQRYWTGEDLLFEGISHGSTSPMILMARTTLDDAPAWHGTGTTAACFFDGSYDQPATYDFLHTNNCTTPVSYQRWLDRYCGAGATPATCDLTTNADALADTITTAPADGYAIHDFHLIECGSANPPCGVTGDILPAPPIAALCAQIDADPAHTCSYAQRPGTGHLFCHQMDWDDCRAWFDGL